MGDATDLSRLMIYTLTNCAREAVGLGWDRDRYLRSVADGYNRARGRQADTHGERMVLAGRVWDALTAP